MNKEHRSTAGVVSGFPRRRRENDYSAYRLVSIIGILFILVLFVIISAQYIRLVQTRSQLAEYEEQLRLHLAKQAALELEIERLKDLNYIEIMARERLGLVKPGDIVFQLED